MTGLKDRTKVRCDFVPHGRYVPKPVSARALLSLKKAVWCWFFKEAFPNYRVYASWLSRNGLDGQNVLAIKETMRKDFGDDKL